MSKKATRVSFGEQLAALGETNPEIVVFDADLAKSTQSLMFGSKYPERFFEMGIQEQNMIGAAAGMATMGKKPFICSFSIFVTGRFETIRMSIAYADVPVTIVGTHCGIGIGEDGYSQMALEDISIMRSLANMTVIQPADDAETKAAVRFLAEYKHPAFLRLTRQGVEQVHGEDYTFEFGKADELKTGSDGVIFATGAVVYNALKAAEQLESEGVNLRVVNIHTIKPLDEEHIIRAAKETGFVLTIEDHSIIGGLGSAVAEVLSEHAPTPMKRIGIYDTFGESGTPNGLYEKYKLDVKGLYEQIKASVQQPAVA
ncbi:MAG: transketolase [Ectothiorhodospiraceae bacterium]|nr:transketolase [Ectothiorhodospiraceae bacterium]